MRKLLISLTAALALLAIFGPYFTGKKVEQKINEELAKLDNYPGYDVELNSYDRSWFSSSASISIALSMIETQIEQLKAADSPETADAIEKWLAGGIEMDLAIKHGPFMPSANNWFGLAEAGFSMTGDPKNEVQQALVDFQSTIGVDQLIEGNTHYSFLGNTSTTAQVPEFRFEQQAGTLNFGGVEISNEVQSDLETNFDVRSGTIDIVAEGMKFEIAPFSLSGEGKLSDDYLFFFGESAASLPEISIDIAGQSGSINKTEFKTGSEQAGEGLINIRFDTDIESIEAGPIGTITDIDYDVSIENLDQSAMVAYYNIQDTLMNADESEFEELYALGKQALRRHPRISIDALGYRLSDSNFLDMKASFSVDPDTAIAALDAGVPQAIIPGLDFVGSISIGEELIPLLQQMAIAQQLENPELTAEQRVELYQQAQSQMSAMFDAFVAQGFIEQTDTSYRTTLEFKNGSATANGKPLM